MSNTKVNISADIDISDIPEEAMIGYLEAMGYTVLQEKDRDFLDEEIEYLLSKVIDTPLKDWFGQRIYDKLHLMRYG